MIPKAGISSEARNPCEESLESSFYGPEYYPLMSLRAAGEAISSFLVGRLPRRPCGLLAMTGRGRVLVPKAVISSGARNPHDDSLGCSPHRMSSFPVHQGLPLNVIASGAKQSPPSLAWRLPSRPYGLLVMTDRGRVLVLKAVISRKPLNSDRKNHLSNPLVWGMTNPIHSS